MDEALFGVHYLAGKRRILQAHSLDVLRHTLLHVAAGQLFSVLAELLHGRHHHVRVAHGVHAGQLFGLRGFLCRLSGLKLCLALCLGFLVRFFLRCFLLFGLLFGLRFVSGRIFRFRAPGHGLRSRHGDHIVLFRRGRSVGAAFLFIRLGKCVVLIIRFRKVTHCKTSKSFHVLCQ